MYCWQTRLLTVLSIEQPSLAEHQYRLIKSDLPDAMQPGRANLPYPE
jgi:hypothetical protein